MKAGATQTVTTPPQQNDYRDVVVVAPASTPYQRYSIETAHWWIARALRLSLQQAGINKQDIDGLSAASFTLFPDTAVALTQHFGLSTRWLDSLPYGGASGIIALRRAARAVQCGDANIVACVAGDTNHIDSFRHLLANFSRSAIDASYPYGFGGPNANFALMTQRYMQTYGVERADFGRICVAQRENALQNPRAVMKKPLSLEQYLAARPIAEPLALFDCVMPCAGAECFLVMRETEARQRQLPFACIDATIERHNAYADDEMQLRGGWSVDREALYSAADCEPGDIDVLQTYDDYPVIVICLLYTSPSPRDS